MCSDHMLLAQKQTGFKMPPKPKTPEEEAAWVEYRMANGNLFFPTLCFRQCLIYAASGKKVKKRSLNKILCSAVFAATDKTPLLDLKGNPIKDYTVDRRGGVNKTAGRIVLCRPRIEEWTWLPELDVDTDYVDAKDVLEPLANEAGTISGLGAYRVSCGGWFGKFKAEIV